MPPPPEKRKCNELEKPEEVTGTIDFSAGLVNVDKGTSTSSSKIVNGFTWMIEAKKTVVTLKSGVNKKCLGFYIYCCKSRESNVWYADCSMKMRLINQNNASNSVEKTFKRRYEAPNSNSFGFRDFKEWDQLIDPTQGFVKDGIIKLSAEITVSSVSGESFRKLILHDFFSESDRSNFVLVVEGRNFYVCKEMLSMHSTFFASMFSNDFKEKNLDKIEIKDVKAMEFEQLLCAIYNINNPIDNKTIDNILKLAEMWNCSGVLDDAERYLMATDQITLARKLVLADSYSLHVLKASCLSKFTKADQISKLRKSEEFSQLSLETQITLYDLHISLCYCPKVVTIDG